MEFKPIMQDTVTDGEKTGHIVAAHRPTIVESMHRYEIAWDGDMGRITVPRFKLHNPTPDTDDLNPFRIKWIVTP